MDSATHRIFNMWIHDSELCRFSIMIWWIVTLNDIIFCVAISNVLSLDFSVFLFLFWPSISILAVNISNPIFILIFSKDFKWHILNLNINILLISICLKTYQLQICFHKDIRKLFFISIIYRFKSVIISLADIQMSCIILF